MLALAALSAGAASCSLDEVPVQIPVTVTEGPEGHVSILYEVEGDMPLTTRGIAASAHEKDIRDVYILFFDTSDSEVADRYVGCTRTSPSPGTSTIKFDLPEDLKENTGYKLLAVGNADSYAGDSDSYEDFLKGLSGDYTTVRSTLLAERKEAVTKENPGLLPLCGRFVGKTDDKETTFSFYKDGEDFIYPNAEDCMFRFQRAICRIDLHNLVGNVLDIQQVRVVNIRTKGSFFIDGFNRGDILEPTFSEGKLGPGAVDMPEISQGEFEEGTRNTLQRLEAELYSFPNTVNTCLPNDRTTTALMISGYYTDPEDGKTDDYLTYYRLNLNNAGEAQSIQRNYCYRASIKGVNRRGERNEQDAYNSTSPVFKYDIGEEWNTDDDNVVTDDKGNFLVVSKSLLTFTGDQSGADVIKLTVNTSDDMEWHIEMDDKSKDLFSYSIISDGTDDKIKAFTCGPNQKNTSDHYYTGSLVVVAVKKDKHGEIQSELRKEIQLVQLTTKGDVKCLIVNGHVSDFEQEVSKYGQTIRLEVITGNLTNRWTATDIDNKKGSWGDNIEFTGRGTSGNYFTITFPANIIEDRFIDIEFNFECDDEDYNNKIKPITVRFHQEKCDVPCAIDGWPQDQKMTLDCFMTDTGWQKANCVAQSKRFSVRLQRPDKHYFNVISSFDQYRDLTLSINDGRFGMGHVVKSIHPDLSYLYERYSTPAIDNTYTKSDYSKSLTKRTNDNPTFYINAFRMGPGDTNITGTITVEVRDKTTNEIVPNGTMILSVTLTVPNTRYMLNDVLIKNNTFSSKVNNNVDNAWIYIMDRNIGCIPRAYTDDSGFHANESKWCFWKESTKTDSWIITNMPNDEQWLGIRDYPIGNDNVSSAKVPSVLIPAWRNQLKSVHGHLGEMYKNADKYPWLLMTKYTLPSIRQHTAVSKGRHFILAEEEVCPKTSKGETIWVATWLPCGYQVGYGFTKTPADGFSDCLALMVNRSNLTSDDFWMNEYGYASHGNVCPRAHLIRLMYMIGYNNQDRPTDLGELGSQHYLPVDSIESQKKYYMNHILKCYEAQ